MVVDAINSSKLSNTAFGDYIRASVHLLDSFESIPIVFVKREANILAQDIARSSVNYRSSCCWTDPPNFVDGLSYTYCRCNNMS